VAHKKVQKPKCKASQALHAYAMTGMMDNTNEVELGEDGSIQVKFFMKIYDTWSKARAK
jgi:hypothetical protein